MSAAVWAEEETMVRAAKRGDEGFSLVELLIAMVVTLIVAGGVFGLLAGGQSAFRVQPEVTDRQQNIRAAMDTIMRDVANAGNGMPPSAQIFTVNLDGQGPAGSSGLATDHLEMLVNTSGRDNEPACEYAEPGQSPIVRIKRNGADIPQNSVVMILMSDPPGTYSVRVETSISPNSSNAGDGCTPGTSHDQLIFNPGADSTGMNPPGGVCGPNNFGDGTSTAPCAPLAIVFADLVRYEIRKVDNLPCLVRTSVMQGNQALVVARGIEDMQVTYQSSMNLGSDDPNTFLPSPAVVVPADFNTLTVQVEVRLSARVPDLGGARDPNMTQAADGTWAIRGQLVSRSAPRSALAAMYQEPRPEGSPSRWR